MIGSCVSTVTGRVKNERVAARWQKPSILRKTGGDAMVVNKYETRDAAVCADGYGKGTPRKLAATDFAALMLTVQDSPETESHPLHPLNNDPGEGDAVSVTTVPLS